MNPVYFTTFSALTTSQIYSNRPNKSCGYINQELMQLFIEDFGPSLEANKELWFASLVEIVARNTVGKGKCEQHKIVNVEHTFD